MMVDAQVAKNAGFCKGVRRAIEIAERASEKGNWYSLGPLVHNESVVEYLKKKGVKPIENIEELKPGSGIIIRAHGVPRQTIDELKCRGFIIEDATCPLVKRIHDKVAALEAEGYSIVVFGDLYHPEVQGIVGWCESGGRVVADAKEALNLPHIRKIGLVSQTTKNEQEFFSVAQALLSKTKELLVCNTICPATHQRQESARDLSQQVDLMLVIGDKKSSNTRTLTQECRYSGVKTHQIHDVSEIDPRWLVGVRKVGITAGASTPDWIIKEVLERMLEYQENNQEKEEETVSDQKNDDNNQENSISHEESFATMEAEMADFPTPARGDVIKGKVIQVLDDEVMVDVGGKSEGIIPFRELSVKEVGSAKDVVKVGDEIEVLVVKWDDDGTILLSKKKVDSRRILDDLEVIFKEKRTVQGTVQSSVNGGLLVDVGVTAFLPASHVDYGYVKNLDAYVGQTLNFKIIEFNRNKRRGSQVVLSRKELIAEERARLKQEFWDTIAEGQTRTGIVKRIVDYGAFIDLGGYEGLLHVSEISHQRVERPADVLQEGQEIEVYILALDREKERVSLSRKKLLKSPWEIVQSKYQEGDIIEGRVVRIAPFGAFVEIEPGVDGLVHISQMANYRVEKAEDVVQVNQVIPVKILSIDPNEKRVSLSVKQAQEAKNQEEVKEYLENQVEE
jgi:ribosomal protein S1/(E)-4-hydroxy-3-methyl-but-2-enyl pyrophosphate reductase